MSEEKGEKQKHRYKDLLDEKEYLKNLCAEGINRFGDSVDAIAFSWLVYTLTGSAALTASIPLVLFLLVSHISLKGYPSVIRKSFGLFLFCHDFV